MYKVFAKTKSVCPICLRTIAAEKAVAGDGFIHLIKTCPEHGFFDTLIWEAGVVDYLKWAGTVPGPQPEDNCPNDCGLCARHESEGCCVLLELTKRCNLRCPVCFASAGGSGDLTVTTSVRSLEYWQKPDVKSVYQPSTGALHFDFGIPAPEQYDYAVAHGTVDLTMPGGIRVNIRVLEQTCTEHVHQKSYRRPFETFPRAFLSEIPCPHPVCLKDRPLVIVPSELVHPCLKYLIMAFPLGKVFPAPAFAFRTLYLMIVMRNTPIRAYYPVITVLPSQQVIHYIAAVAVAYVLS